MSWLSDDAISRLQTASARPDFSATRYRLLERIASGGMGTVYSAEDSILDRRVALKILDVPDASGELAARLLREAAILARLEHPGIVPVHDAGTLGDGRVFYAMKFVEGERLDRLITRTELLPERLRLFQKICEPVGFAHSRGILHRDLKPENIMVGSFGEVLVMDWGISKVLNDARIAKEFGESVKDAEQARGGPLKTAHGAILGTPGYMAPEQERGEVDALTPQTDIYSLGAILQFLVQGGSDSAANPVSMPAPLAAIVRKAMAGGPADRYASARELSIEVARYLDGLPVSAYPENIFRRLARWAARYRVAIVVVVTYLIVRTLLALWLRR